MKEKIIIICFFLLLLLPNITYLFLGKYIDNENHEKRQYAEFPVITKDTIFEFPEQFEAFYLDRIPYKNQLKRLHSYKEMAVNSKKSVFEVVSGMGVVTVGQDGWLFYTVSAEGENSVADYIGTNLYTAEQLQSLADSYTKVNDYFQKNNQQFILFIAPNKEHVYSEFMPDNLQSYHSDNRTEQAVEYLQANSDVVCIDMYDQFMKMKKQYDLYYKLDTHWNKLGAFLGVQEINGYLKGYKVSLSDVEITSSKITTGDLLDLLGMYDGNMEDTTYQITGYNSEIQYELVEEDEEASFRRYKSNAKDERKVLLIHDSFSYSMMSLLASDYGELICTTSTDKAKQIIQEEKPDVIILELVERFSARFETQALKLLPEE